MLETWPIPIHGGFPLLAEDLRWKDDLPLYVVGGLASLAMGPDAGNLLGIRRAVRVVANGLECRCWRHGKALFNPFTVILGDDSSAWDDSSDTHDSIGETTGIGLESAFSQFSLDYD